MPATGTYSQVISVTNSRSNLAVDPNLTAPRQDTYSVGVDRQLRQQLAVNASYVYKHGDNLVGWRDIGGVYGTGTTVLPDGRTLAIFPLLNSASQRLFQWTNRPNYVDNYNAFIASLVKRMSNRWMMRGNVTLSDWKDHCGSDSLDDPTPQITTNGTTPCSGGVFVQRSNGSGSFPQVFINAKWTANVNAVYQLPWDFSLGANLNARQGYPQPLQEEIDVPSGLTKSVVLKPVGDTRYANVYELDLRAAKDFRFMNRAGLTLAADLFNVPNKRAILQREPQRHDRES